jgi:YD repeat-containing protein
LGALPSYPGSRGASERIPGGRAVHCARTRSCRCDSLNRLTQSTDGAGNAVGYGYDLANNLTSLTYPGPVSVTRSYDGDNRLTAVTDWLSNTTRFGYDPNSNLSSDSYPNGVTASYSYTTADQLARIVDRQSGAPLWDFTYTRDPLGQVQTATDPVANSSHTYGYDQLNRLQTDQQSSSTASYTYDAANQLTDTSSTPIGYSSGGSYDAGGELTAFGKTRRVDLTRLGGDRKARADRRGAIRPGRWHRCADS